MVVDELDRLLSKNAGCRTIAFADLSAQMILVTDSASNLPREMLDRLCREAVGVLGINGKPVLGEQPGARAFVAGPSGLHVFLRASDEPDDVLCCVCNPEINVDEFMADATACLNRISNGDA